MHLINNAWCRVKDWDRGRATTMKILVVHPHLNLVGGSEILTKILVYELAGQGHEVIVVTKDRREDLFPDAPNVRFEFIKDIPELYKLSLRKMTTGKIMTLFYTLDHAIETHEPEVALVMIQEPIYAALIKFSRPGLGTALYIHYPFEEELTPQNLAKFIDMYRFPDLYVSLYKVADLHMTNSNYTAKILHKRFGIESNVVYPAVDWKFFENEPSLSDDRGNVIITVGRFVPHKRQDLMIEMFAKRIRPVVKDAQLVVVGMVDVRYEDYYAKLRQLSQETEGVELVDRSLTPEEMVEMYRRAKVYVHLRIGEHFGMAPVEAMSQATIPIVPRASGLAEMITPGRNGYTFANDEEIADYITKVLSMPTGDLAKMRLHCIRTAWYFNPDRFAKEILSYLRLMTE